MSAPIDGDSALLKAELKEQAARLGFDACGISAAVRLDEEALRLEKWLGEGRHGSMSWMERNFEKRVNPAELVPGAQSVISVLHTYYTDYSHSDDADIGNISRYAWGDDYHDVLKEKLTTLLEWLDKRVGGVAGRAFVDSAPVMDKVWAQRSGLGWIGKHSNLISRDIGSFFFIGELIVDLDLPADDPISDFCGSCTRCIDACPTHAIYPAYVVDANRCISYLTIESRAEVFPEELEREIGSWIFGCDICQDVCPWNKFKRPASEPRFLPRPGAIDTPLSTWAGLTPENFNAQFKGSAVKRAKPEGFQRNVAAAARNRQAAPDLPA